MSVTAGEFLTWLSVFNVSTNTGSKFLPLSGGTLTGALNMSGFNINNVGTPTLSTQAATKGYADTIAAGLIPQIGVTTATTTALTVTYSNGTAGVGATLTNAGTQAALEISGYTPAIGDRILVCNQAAPAQNGVYTATNLGSGSTNWVMTRATNYDTSGEILPGTLFSVSAGTQLGWSYYESATVTTIGTDPILFSPFFVSSEYLIGANNLVGVASVSASRANLSVPATSTYAGNPNGNVAGAVGDFCCDSTDDDALYYCNSAGDSADAEWALVVGSSSPSPFTFGAGMFSAIGGGTSSTGSAATGAISFGNGGSVLSQYAGAFGNSNTIGTSAANAFTAGSDNTISNGATNSAVFGFNNLCGGSGSFMAGENGAIAGSANYATALGNGATVNNIGSFVWSDSTNAGYSDTGINQFVIGGTGGVWIYTSAALSVAIDANGNLINKQAVADQSYSYQVPSDAFTITMANNCIFLSLNPSGALSSGTVNMPSSPIDGQLATISTSQNITSFTLSGTLAYAPTTLLAGQGLTYQWSTSNSVWMIKSNDTTGGGGGSSPWSAGAGTGSAIGGDGTSSCAANYSLSYGGAGTVASGATYAVNIGYNNTVDAAAQGAAVFGQGNTTNAPYSFMAGIGNTVATGALYGVALGNNAVVSYQGSFVWSDSTDLGYGDNAANQFVIEASGGLWVYSTAGLSFSIDGNGRMITTQAIADQSYSYQVPSNGFNITMGAESTFLSLNPASTLATGTVTMPAGSIDGQLATISTSNTITALSLNAAGGDTLAYTPTTLKAGQGITYQYSLANTLWMIKSNDTTGGGGGSSPFTAGSGTDSAYGLGGTDGGADYSFAVGRNAIANNSGSMVFFDNSNSGNIADDTSKQLVFNFTNGWKYYQGGTLIFSVNASAGFTLGKNATVNGHGNAFAGGFGASCGGNGGFVWGSGATSNHQGSLVVLDNAGNGGTVQDTANNQFVTSFSGGYFGYTGTTLSWSTTTAGNFIALGTVAADNAASGNIGEVISLNIPLASGVSLSANTSTDIGYIDLTAGDWDVDGNVTVQFTGIASYVACWLSTTSATIPADISNFCEVQLSGVSGTNIGLTTPKKRVNVSTTTRVYVSVQALAGSGSATGCGNIYARRMR